MKPLLFHSVTLQITGLTARLWGTANGKRGHGCWSGCALHVQGSFCHNIFLQGNQHKWKTPDALVHQSSWRTKVQNGSCPDLNLIQENKQGITQQTSNLQSKDYAHEANSFMDQLPHLLPPATETRLKWPLMTWWVTFLWAVLILCCFSMKSQIHNGNFLFIKTLGYCYVRLTLVPYFLSLKILFKRHFLKKAIPWSPFKVVPPSPDTQTLEVF